MDKVLLKKIHSHTMKGY